MQYEDDDKYNYIDHAEIKPYQQSTHQNLQMKKYSPLKKSDPDIYHTLKKKSNFIQQSANFEKQRSYSKNKSSHDYTRGPFEIAGEEKSGPSEPFFSDNLSALTNQKLKINYP